MIWTIAKRELFTRGKSKGFIVMTSIVFIAVIVGSLLAAFLGGEDEAQEVTIGLTPANPTLAAFLEVGNEDLAPTVIPFANDDGGLESGEEALENDELDVWLNGNSITWKGLPDFTLDSYLRSQVRQLQFQDNANTLGLEEADIESLFATAELDEVRLDGGDDEFLIRIITASISGIATFLMLQIWGAFLMMGVIEEKSSKVVEILLSHVSTSTLLSGKILGLGILALIQMCIMVAGVAIGLTVTDIEVPDGLWATVPLMLVVFLLGFAFYATAFAAVGSTVSRQEDAQGAQLPAMIPLFSGYMIAATSFSTPENLAVTIGSFVPFTSPVLLPFRMALVGLPAWQVVVSLIILAVSAVLMIKVAGGIYRFSLLRSGSRVTWSELWKARTQVTGD